MKKIILIIFTICFISSPTKAIQLQQSQIDKMAGSPSGNTTKIYNQYSSYQGKLVQKSNGQIRQYGKTGSFQGYYKKQGSKLKYYPKK